MLQIGDLIKKITYIFFSILLIINYLFFWDSLPLLHLFKQTNNYLYHTLYSIGILVIAILGYYFTYKSNLKFKKIYLYLLLGFTFISRFILITILKVIPKSDFNTYHIFAKAMANNEIIGHNYISLFPHYYGYPYFLSIFYRIFGSQAYVAQMLNVILSCVIVILLFNIGKLVFNRIQVGFLSALIWSIWPSQMLYSVFVCTELVFTCLMLLCTYIFLIGIKKEKSNLISRIYLISVGVMCALSNMIRPLALIVLLAFIIYCIFYQDEDKDLSWRKKVIFKSKRVALLLISYAIITQLLGVYVSSEIDKQIAKKPYGFNLYVGMNIESGGRWNEGDSQLLESIILEEKYSAQEIHDKFLEFGVQRIQKMSVKEFINHIKNKNTNMWNLDQDVVNYLKHSISYDDTSIDFLKYERILIKLSNFFYYVILIISAIGTLAKVINKNFNNKEFIFYMIIVGVFLVHNVFEVASRYHFITISLFTLIAAASLTSDKFSEQKQISKL